MVDSGHPCWFSFYNDKNENSAKCRSLGPLSSPEPDFTFEHHYPASLFPECLSLYFLNGEQNSHKIPLFSNVLLLHKLLITGKGNLVVSRKAELDRDLLKKTCQYRPYSGATVTKVSCRRILCSRLRIFKI